MSDQLANVRFGKNKTEAEILSGGANSIIPGQTWITSDTKRIIHRRKDDSTFEFVKANIGEPVPVNGVLYAWNGNQWVSIDDQTFLDHPDTPNSYSGAGGKRVTVNEAEDGLEFVRDPFIPLPGVDENKVYISKVNDNTISVIAGSGTIRKSNLTEVKRTWNAIASIDVSSVLDGQLRWCVFQNDGTETGLEFTLLSSAPVLLDDAEQYLWIGRIWREAGVLQVGDHHIMLSVDPQVSRTNVWQFPAGNVSVMVHHATDVGLLSLSAGELTRWPVVESGTYHHVWKYNGLATVSSMWDHVQGSAGFTTISDNLAGNTTDIRTIADYYDNNGNLAVVPTNDWVAHLVGVYAGSEERVLFRGQRTYTTLADAKLGITIDPLEEADWAKDLRQISKIGWMLVREGTRDFSNSARCVFVPYSLLGSGGGSGTTPNLEQVLNVSGDVDITDSLDTDRVMSFIKNGVRQLSLFGNGSLQGQLGIFADMVMGDSRTAGTHLVDRSIECGVSGDLGGVINTVDVVESSADFVFTSSNGSFAGNGDYTDSGLTHNGKPYYVNGIYFLAYGIVTAVGGLWFIVTTLESGDLMFSNALYQQNAISETPDGVDEYTGQNAEANNGAEIIVPTGATRPSIVGETIVSKNTIGIISGTTTQAELQGMIDAGVTMFKQSSSAGTCTIPSGTYSLKGDTYFFTGSILEPFRIPSGGVTFNFPVTPVGAHKISFDCSLYLEGSLSIFSNGAGGSDANEVSMSGTQTITTDQTFSVVYLNERHGVGGTINSGGGGITYQFKESGVIIGTGSISQLNWKYPITQS